MEEMRNYSNGKKNRKKNRKTKDKLFRRREKNSNIYFQLKWRNCIFFSSKDKMKCSQSTYDGFFSVNIISAIFFLFYSILFYEVWKDKGYMKREQFLAAFSFRERSCFWAEMKSQNCNLSTVKNFLSSNWVGYQTFVVGWVEEFRLYIPAAVNRENQISLWISSVAWYFGLDLLFFEVKNTHGCDIH